MTLAIHHLNIKIKACCTKKITRPFVSRLICVYNRLRYQVSIYRTTGPLVLISFIEILSLPLSLSLSLSLSPSLSL